MVDPKQKGRRATRNNNNNNTNNNNPTNVSNPSTASASVSAMFAQQQQSAAARNASPALVATTSDAATAAPQPASIAGGGPAQGAGIGVGAAGISPALYAQIMQNPQLMQQMMMQQHNQRRMAAAAAANNTNLANFGLNQPTPQQNAQVALFSLMNASQNGGAANTGATTTVGTPGATNPAALAAMMQLANAQGNSALAAQLINNPAMMQAWQMQLIRQRQMAVQNAAAVAAASGTINQATVAAAAAAGANHLAHMNPAFAAAMQNSAQSGMNPQMAKMMHNAQVTAALATSGGVPNPVAPPTPVPLSAPTPTALGAPSPAATGPDAAPPATSQVAPATQQGIQGGATPISQMSLPQLLEGRTRAGAFIRNAAEQANRTDTPDDLRCEWVLKRLGAQIQLLQLDHYFKVRSGVVMSEAEQGATKAHVQTLKLQMAQVQVRRQALAKAAAAQAQQAAGAASSEATAALNVNPAGTAPVTTGAAYPALQRPDLARVQQQTPATTSTVLGHSISPQQSRRLFGGPEAYLGGTHTGPLASLGGFMQNCIPRLPPGKMENLLHGMLEEDEEAGRAGGGDGVKRKVGDLLAEIGTGERVDLGVEDVLYEFADNFIDQVTQFACKLALHRKSKVAKIKDFQFTLERSWNLRIPHTITHSLVPAPTPGTASGGPGAVTAAGAASAIAAATSVEPFALRPVLKRHPPPAHVARVMQVRKAVRDDQAAILRARVLEAQRRREATGGVEDEEPDGEENEKVALEGMEEVEEEVEQVIDDVEVPAVAAMVEVGPVNGV